jgi:hypothetical protein
LSVVRSTIRLEIAAEQRHKSVFMGFRKVEQELIGVDQGVINWA